MIETSRLIEQTVAGGIATITLSRLPVNVINIAMLYQLEEALESLSTDESVRVLLLTAEGKLFSAGVDVAEHTAEHIDEMIPLFDRVCRALADFPLPTIAAVEGHALGGGCELVLCCDLAIMSDAATISQPEIQLASIAPVAALRLPYLVGYRAAADMLLSGRKFSADEALRAGLVNEVVPASQVMEHARAKAAELASLSRAAQLINKHALKMGFHNWTEMMPAMERLVLNDLMKTKDAHEGLKAFMEKRPPEWKHS